jgi:hypothetical protein
MTTYPHPPFDSLDSRVILETTSRTLAFRLQDLFFKEHKIRVGLLVRENQWVLEHRPLPSEPSLRQVRAMAEAYKAKFFEAWGCP